MNAKSASGVVIALAVLMGVGTAAGAQESKRPDADASLNALVAIEWKWRETQIPDGEDTQRPIPNFLPQVDPAAQEARLRYWEDVLRQLDAIARDDLSSGGRLNYDVYRPQIEVLIANQRFRDFEMPANSDTTFWTDLGATARRPFLTLQDYRSWLAQNYDTAARPPAAGGNDTELTCAAS